MHNKYTLNFAPSVIESLGIGLYKQIPQALEELISNSWDADATKVQIIIDYSKKEIKVLDNGNGMTYEELNSDFLTVSKNRRLSGDITKKGRSVTGKKGLGKLALFGIANEIQVTSVKDGKKNAFSMNFKKIKETKSNDRYHPNTISYNENVDKPKHGTCFLITDLTIKNIMPLEDLQHSLARRFNKYSKDNFLVTLSDSKGNEVNLDEEAFFENIKPKNVQFEFKFPDDFKTEIEEKTALKELNDHGIKGVVYTASKPLRAKEQGFGILIRGKLTGDPITYQFSDRANDNFYSYSAGYFEMDFIDEDKEEDFISTDRQSVLWDKDENLIKTRNCMQSLINIIMRKWRNKRASVRLTERQKNVEDIIDGSPKIKSALNSNNLTKSDYKIIDTVKEVFTNPKNKVSNEDIESTLLAALSNTDGYKIDNSLYKELIPKDFIIPEKINLKIRKILDEAKSLPSDKTNKDKFIISQGLLFRALVDATTTTLIVHNFQEMKKQDSKNTINNELKKSEKRGTRRTPGTYEWTCNLPLKRRLRATIEYLKEKGDLNSEKDVRVYSNRTESDNIIENLDLLMHSDHYYINFDGLKNMWSLLYPIISKALRYIENEK
ncbi:MAG: ATP-binding protein [Gilliamella sp.]|nr:ATP-binding protein [Gilliamella sp.]MCO6557752.1 ATP-binding protein [Gilliamella sp.]